VRVGATLVRATNNNVGSFNDVIRYVVLDSRVSTSAAGRDFLVRLLGLGGLPNSPAAATCWLQQLAIRRSHVLLSIDRGSPQGTVQMPGSDLSRPATVGSRQV
jgi:hypothetical protein